MNEDSCLKCKSMLLDLIDLDPFNSYQLCYDHRVGMLRLYQKARTKSNHFHF